MAKWQVVTAEPKLGATFNRVRVLGEYATKKEAISEAAEHRRKAKAKLGLKRNQHVRVGIRKAP